MPHILTDVENEVVEALEKSVIFKCLDLHPTLGVVYKSEPTDDEKSYVRAIRKCADKYAANVIEKRVSDIRRAYEAVTELSENQTVCGIMILSSFGKAADQALRDHIPTLLDVDCASSLSLGRLVTDTTPVPYRLAPCAPAAVIKILTYGGCELSGKRVGVVGRSLRVGTPLATLLKKYDATVELFHSKSDLTPLKDKDVVVTAIGKPQLLTGSLFSPGQWVIDLGCNVTNDGSIVGDCDFASVCDAIGDDGYINAGTLGKVTNAVLFAKLFTNAAHLDGRRVREG